MLRLGRLTDYAVTLLSHMGMGDKGDCWAATRLAEKSGLSATTTSKILKLLAKARLVSAQRGASGGYKLSRAPSEISIMEIIEAVDGPIALTECSGKSGRVKCKIRRLCPMSRGWNKLNHAMRDALSKVSLAEMFAPPIFDTLDALPQEEP